MAWLGVLKVEEEVLLLWLKRRQQSKAHEEAHYGWTQDPVAVLQSGGKEARRNIDEVRVQ